MDCAPGAALVLPQLGQQQRVGGDSQSDEIALVIVGSGVIRGCDTDR